MNGCRKYIFLSPMAIEYGTSLLPSSEWYPTMVSVVLNVNISRPMWIYELSGRWHSTVCPFSGALATNVLFAVNDKMGRCKPLPKWRTYARLDFGGLQFAETRSCVYTFTCCPFISTRNGRPQLSWIKYRLI